MGTNGGQSQSIERGDEIAELRRQVASLLMRLPMIPMTLILILRTPLEFLQGEGLIWKEMSEGLTTTSRLKFQNFKGVSK